MKCRTLCICESEWRIYNNKWAWINLIKWKFSSVYDSSAICYIFFLSLFFAIARTLIYYHIFHICHAHRSVHNTLKISQCKHQNNKKQKSREWTKNITTKGVKFIILDDRLSAFLFNPFATKWNKINTQGNKRTINNNASDTKLTGRK